jgi:hypothetical protein
MDLKKAVLVIGVGAVLSPAAALVIRKGKSTRTS